MCSDREGKSLAQVSLCPDSHETIEKDQRALTVELIEGREERTSASSYHLTSSNNGDGPVLRNCFEPPQDFAGDFATRLIHQIFCGHVRGKDGFLGGIHLAGGQKHGLLFFLDSELLADAGELFFEHEHAGLEI
jgi:hypothetical protein